MKKVFIVDNGFNMLFKEIVDSIENSKKLDKDTIEKSGTRIIELSEGDRDRIYKHIFDEMISDMGSGINPIVAGNTILPLKSKNRLSPSRKISKLEEMDEARGNGFKLIRQGNTMNIVEKGSTIAIATMEGGIESAIGVVNRFGFNFEYVAPLKKIKRSELEKWCFENGLGYMNHKDKVENIYTYEKDGEGRFCNMKAISPEEVGIEIIEG